MTFVRACIRCGSSRVKRDGRNTAGNQRMRCLDCGRQFVYSPPVEPQPRGGVVAGRIEIGRGALWAESL